MAQKSKTGKYLNLEDVRVSYDPKSDMFSVTAADSELKELGGLKLDVSHSSKAHGALKKLLKTHGVIQGDPWPRISDERALELFESNGNPRQVPIGTNINGELQTWNFEQFPNLWIYGGMASGDSFAKRSLMIHGLIHGWDIRALDTTGIELPKELSPGKTHSDILTELGDIERLIEDRFAELEAIGAQDHGNRYQTVLVILEDLIPILEYANADDPAAAVYRSMGRSIMEILAKIGLLGRAADVHLVVGVQDSWKIEAYGFEDLADELIPEHGRMAGYLVLGRLRKGSLPKDMRARYKQLRSSIIRRGKLFNFGIQNELEVLALPREKLDGLLEAHTRQMS